ncbi:phage tail length tape measure family protein [Tritonibacter mobilis]|uniref:phage tail length tape measure family protein n=1 Tax=Tritonibacter mobilis TaxID=379347 RepID=UPI000806B9AD|nr:phage tail length tape measure family protein [Tritonibacter mobilis]
MTFVVQGEILMDGSDAKSELQRLRAEQAKVVSSTDKANQSSTRWGRTVSGVRSRLSNLRSGASSWVAGLRNVDDTQELAAGSLANLTSQFNDVTVMMAAGQNPMQLAIQQGTQITQVFGNRGAAAALAATRQAAINMISPLNLITIGSIAASAAAVQWLTSASKEAETFEDRLQAMSDAVEVFGKRQEEAFQSTADMIKGFGSASPELRAVLQDLAAMARLDAQEEIDGISESIRGLVIAGNSATEMSRMFDAGDFLGFGSANRAGRAVSAQFASSLDAMRDAIEPAERLRAALDIRDVLLETSGGIENLSARQEEFYNGLAQLIQELEAFGATVRQPWDDLRETGKDLWSDLTANAKEYLDTRLEVDASARSTIEQLQLEAEINEAIRTSGEGSVEVAELRLQAERELFEQRVEELTITEELKKEMMAAWDAANGVAGVDMAGNIALAAGEAQRLKNELLAAKGAAIMAAAKANPDFHDPRGESPGSGNKEYVYQDQGLPRVVLPPNPRSRRSGGGRSASSADREREAIERLMQRERERLEILRETDPVQQEMIRFRETMKSATDAEREALEKIIGKRLEEQKAIEQTRELGSYLGETMQDVSAALVSSGDAAADAWDRVKASILSAILQASLLGEGPLAGAFGTDETGGFIGGLLKRADGGIITGRGGDRSDQELVLASPGEFFVNAKATRKHRHLLEAINAGSLLPAALPAFANGGAFAAPPVLPAASAGGSSQAPGMSRVRIEPSPLFRAVVEEQSRQTAVEVNQNYDREHSGEAFNRNLNDPWSVG